MSHEMNRLRPQRLHESRLFVPNGIDTINLPIGYDLDNIGLYLSGLFNVTTAFAGCKLDGLAKLIKRVELVHDGETLSSLTGEQFFYGNPHRNGFVSRVNPWASVGLQPGSVSGFLDLSLVGSIRPKDSSLRTLGSRQLQLRIVWGVLSDMYTGAGACSPAIPVVTLNVAVREYHEIKGTQLPELRRLYKTNEISYPSGKVDKIQLDSNVYYKGILLRSESNGEVSVGVINSIKVQVGSDVIFDMPAWMLVDVNRQDLNINLFAGYLWLDFAPAPSGLSKLGDFLDLHGRQDAFLILDVNGGPTNKVQIVQHEFEVLHNHIAHNEQGSKPNSVGYGIGR
jgi:hypothetical protein